jgi:acetyl esterase/lipase
VPRGRGGDGLIGVDELMPRPGERRRRWRLASAAISVVLGALLVWVAAPGAALGASESPESSERTLQTGDVLLNVTYCSDSGEPLLMDLYAPTIATKGPYPVVLLIHGGTWMVGTRSDARNSLTVAALRAAGIAVAAMDYSLAPAHRFPDMVLDLTCGVRHLRAKASTYGIDPKHIGALGLSSGGHLAAMLGVNDGSSTFVGGGYKRYSSKVQAVAGVSGVYDLTLHDLAPYDERVLPQIFGRKRTWGAASPVTYVRGGLPPFLLLHGDDDTDVPLVQSRVMARALRRAGDSESLVVVHNAGHLLAPTGAPMSPRPREVRAIIVHFFATKLR